MHDMNKTPHTASQSNPRIYVLHPYPQPKSECNSPAAGSPKTDPAQRPPLPARQPLPTAVIDPNKPLLKLGLDVHLEFIMAVGQKDHSQPKAPVKYTNDELVAQVARWHAQGLQVVCVQESCGFGFSLHRRLVQAGAQSLVITPVALNGPRKTDKLDARALCLRLSRFLDGNPDELAPIRIPTETEQRRRETTRRRQFLCRLLRSLANRGHGLAAEYSHLKLPYRWWGPRLWKKLAAALDPWLAGVLGDLRHLILQVEEQINLLRAEIEARVAKGPRPKGLGALTLATVDAEVCDWSRFFNRKHIGSYTGCCPGEHSSGGKRRLGSIDRMGNGRVRALLVEAVWRFFQWQPGWKAALRLRAKLNDGPSMRKKAIVALARQLAIDLWRWRTGRCTMEELGWVAA